MGKFRVTSPEGKSFEITAPEGATQEQVLSYAQQQFSAQPAEPSMSPELQSKMNMAGAEPRNPFDPKAMVLPMAGSLIGGIGGVPGQVVGGMAGETANQALGIGHPKSVFPELNEYDLGKIGLTGAANLVPPLISKAYGVVKGAAQPFYDAGRKAIIGRTLGEAAGGENILPALQGAKQLVPGSLPTAAQATQNPGIASLERAASAVHPSVEKAFAAREAAQDLARQKLLGAVSGDESALASAVASRAKQAATNYGAAGKELVSPDDALNALLSRPSMKSILPRAQSLVEESGKSFHVGPGGMALDHEIPVSDLHAVKMAMDDLIKNPERFGIGGSEARAITKTQEDFLKWLGAKSPAYTGAREAFKEASGPINQMEVAQAIAEKSKNALTDKLMPSKYANALSDRTAQTTLGRDDATLEALFGQSNQMGPTKMRALEAIKEDLARAVNAQNLGGTRGSDTVKKLAYTNMMDRAGIPTFLREFAPTQMVGNIMARGADSIYGRQNKEIAEQLAMTLLDPKKAAEAMHGAGGSRYASLIDALVRNASAAGGAIAGRRDQ